MSAPNNAGAFDLRPVLGDPARVAPFDIARALADPTQVAEIPRELLPAALSLISALLVAVSGRMLAEAHSVQPSSGEDRLLDVEVAAQRLGMSTSRLYREASNFPFTVRNGRSVRFSSRGIDSYIRQRRY